MGKFTVELGKHKVKVAVMKSLYSEKEIVMVCWIHTFPFALPVKMNSPFLSNEATMFCSHCKNLMNMIKP